MFAAAYPEDIEEAEIFKNSSSESEEERAKEEKKSVKLVRANSEDSPVKLHGKKVEEILTTKKEKTDQEHETSTLFKNFKKQLQESQKNDLERLVEAEMLTYQHAAKITTYSPQIIIPSLSQGKSQAEKEKEKEKEEEEEEEKAGDDINLDDYLQIGHAEIKENIVTDKELKEQEKEKGKRLEEDSTKEEAVNSMDIENFVGFEDEELRLVTRLESGKAFESLLSDTKVDSVLNPFILVIFIERAEETEDDENGSAEEESKHSII
jgi:hypothetical protein